MAPNQLLAAADQVAAAALPTREIGSVLPPRPPSFVDGAPSWSVLEAQQRTVPVDALRWPFSVQTYEAMRRDPQIQGLLTSVFLPIRHMRWYLDPGAAPDSLVTELSEDLGLPVGDDDDVDDTVGFDFDDHLRQALLALAIGHRFFEESGEITGDGAGARYRLTRLSDRPPSTLSRISVAANGDLVDIQQTGMFPVPIIPADRLVAYVWDREGGNWAGRPLLYGIYRSWFLKDELVRADAVKHRRFNGIPVVETTDPNVGKEAADEAALMAQRLQAGDGAGANTPYGTRLRLLGVEGSLPDTIASIQYHDQQMARAFMQMFAELGQNAHGGSRALGTTLMDHYALGVLAVAKWARKPLMGLVRRIAVRNYGPGVVVPQVRFRQDDHEDITMTDLVALIDAGAVVVDDDLETQIRERANLVARNQDEPGRTPPGSTPPGSSPSPAPAARRRHRHGTAAAGDPSPAERSGTDFADLQAKFEDVLASLTVAWDTHRQAIVDQLVERVIAATSPAELAAVAADVPDVDWLTGPLKSVTAHGAEAVVAEAKIQGHTMPAASLTDADTTIADAAAGTVTMLTRSLELSAASKAVQLAGLTPADRGQQVRDHLDGLAGANADYELRGLVTKAQNEGRFTQMGHAPDSARFYASELNDTNTCDPCAEEDETEFDSLDEARGDYPSGFALCEGGDRCRGTVVMVLDEAVPSA